jgi:hypothetical protein
VEVLERMGWTREIGNLTCSLKLVQRRRRRAIRARLRVPQQVHESVDLLRPKKKGTGCLLGKMECFQSDLSMSSIQMYNSVLTIATERRGSRSSPGDDGVEENSCDRCRVQPRD